MEELLSFLKIPFFYDSNMVLFVHLFLFCDYISWLEGNICFMIAVGGSIQKI